MSQENKDSVINQPGKIAFDDTGAAIETGSGRPILVCQGGQIRTTTKQQDLTEDFIQAYVSVVLTARTNL